MTRWNGSLIGVQKNTSLTDSTGVWNLRRQTLAKQNGVWPLDNSTIPQPNWSLDFSSGSPWANGSQYSFISTTSTGRTYIDSSGYISTCISNITTNNSEAINTGTGVSVTPNTIEAPDGETTADVLNEIAGTSFHHGTHTTNTGIVANTRYTFSMYVKKPTTNTRNNFFYMSVDTFGGTVVGYASTFDIVNGTISSDSGSFVERGSPQGQRGIESLPNNWFRIWISLVAPTGTTSLNLYYGGVTSLTPTWSSIQYSGYTVATGDEKIIAYAWGVQINAGGLLPYSRSTGTTNGIPRLTHDRNGSRLGLLIEGSVTNGLLYSNDLSTTWQLSGVTRSLNQNSPANDTTALRLVEQAGSTGHVIYIDVTRTNVVFSAYLKKDQRTAASMKFWLAGNNWCNCTFNLDAGTAGSIVTSTTNSFTNTSSGIENAGNNWYRCWIRATVPTNSSVQHSISLNTTPTPTLRTDNGSQDYEGNTANGIFIWGAQSEEANRNPSSYIPTLASAVTRNEDRVHVTKSKITNWSSPGAVCVHFYKPLQAGTLVATDNAATEELGIQASSTTEARAFWSNGQTATGEIGEPVVQKAVHYWNGTTSKFCINGTTVQTETNNVSNFNNTNFITLGAEATDSSGSPGTFSNYANCVIRKVEFYAGSLTDTNLQEITQGDAAYPIEYLVVAGGGGGGGATRGGGGGAGGYRTATNFTLTQGISYTVTVGAGGGAGANGANGTTGSNSVFSTIISDGGGGGGGTGANGGSGGGGGYSASAGGTATSGQGNNGGAGASGYPGAGGGGGGAGAAGAAGSGTTPGNGGNGSASSITGTSVTRAGGGGGAVPYGTISDAHGSGGTGGGGRGAGNVTAVAGTANTGGGGGGGALYVNSANSSAAGGSGVVILRMASNKYSGVYTGTPDVSQVGDDTVLVFNSSGSYRA